MAPKPTALMGAHPMISGKPYPDAGSTPDTAQLPHTYIVNGGDFGGARVEKDVPFIIGGEDMSERMFVNPAADAANDDVLELTEADIAPEQAVVEPAPSFADKVGNFWKGFLPAPKTEGTAPDLSFPIEVQEALKGLVPNSPGADETAEEFSDVEVEAPRRGFFSRLFNKESLKQMVPSPKAAAKRVFSKDGAKDIGMGMLLGGGARYLVIGTGMAVGATGGFALMAAAGVAAGVARTAWTIHKDRKAYLADHQDESISFWQWANKQELDEDGNLARDEDGKVVLNNKKKYLIALGASTALATLGSAFATYAAPHIENMAAPLFERFSNFLSETFGGQVTPPVPVAIPAKPEILPPAKLSSVPHAPAAPVSAPAHAPLEAKPVGVSDVHKPVITDAKPTAPVSIPDTSPAVPIATPVAEPAASVEVAVPRIEPDLSIINADDTVTFTPAPIETPAIEIPNIEIGDALNTDVNPLPPAVNSPVVSIPENASLSIEWKQNAQGVIEGFIKDAPAWLEDGMELEVPTAHVPKLAL